VRPTGTDFLQRLRDEAIGFCTVFRPFFCRFPPVFTIFAVFQKRTGSMD
jgi:hypothetical protein